MIHHITPLSEIDWEYPGKRIYHVPFTSDGEWARIRVPLCVICGSRPGKTIAAIGGTHGDEYEGPIAFKRHINVLEAEDVQSGRLIILPALNVQALFNDTREYPSYGGNMNRAFPGLDNGSVTQRIARFVTDEVLSRADVVIDIHAGGRSLQFAPCTSFHSVEDSELLKQYKETAFLFGMPFTLIYAGGLGTGLLTQQAESMGKITIGGEFGFGASANIHGVVHAYEGLLNVMRYYGLMQGQIVPLLSPEYDRQRIISNQDLDSYITAPFSGVTELLIPLGSFVKKGQPVVRIHDYERIDEVGCEMYADKAGYVAATRFRAQTNQGDIVMVIAGEY